jgi:hypothetical protein
MKDHQKRELLDKLTATAIEYAGQQQLRLQLQAVLFPALDEMTSETLENNNASWRMFVSKMKTS